MHEVVSIAVLYPVMEEMLKAGGCIALMASGMSMLPMLRNNQDTVVLGPVTGPLHVNDVVLYRRTNGQFVLHRIVGLESNGDYILCGDNQYILEHHIEHHQVVSRLQAFIRNSRRISCTSPWYKTYVCFLPALRFTRRVFDTGRRNMCTLKRRIDRLMNRKS